MSRALLEGCRRRHLVLHMDINKTIIQTDPAGGRTLTDVLNSNAAANVFGVVDGNKETGGEVWRPLFSVEDTPEQQSAARATVRDQELITYADYVDRAFCEPPEMAQMPKAERDQLWKKISGERRKAVHDFTFPGALGAAYASLVDKQRHALSRPDTTSSSAHIDGVAVDPANDLSRYYTIIPSFFHLINCLSDLSWPFTLIFRTFGNDLGRVLEDWECFVRGQHPCRPSGPVLAKLAQTPYVKPLTACVYREKDRLFLCYGPNVSASTLPPSFVQKEQPSPEEIHTALRGLPGHVRTVETSFHTLQGDLRRYFDQSHNIGGLVDYYPCWAQSAEHRDGGKVYAVRVPNTTHKADVTEEVESEKEEVHAEYDVFFDDNISLGDRFSIVDIRDAESGQSICDREVEEPFCVPVNAYKAIVDENYFIECLCDRLQRQSHAMDAAAAARKRKREV